MNYARYGAAYTTDGHYIYAFNGRNMILSVTQPFFICMVKNMIPTQICGKCLETVYHCVDILFPSM